MTNIEKIKELKEKEYLLDRLKEHRMPAEEILAISDKNMMLLGGRVIGFKKMQGLWEVVDLETRIVLWRERLKSELTHWLSDNKEGITELLNLFIEEYGADFKQGVS